MNQENEHSPSPREYRVKITTNGPYLVSGGVPLSDQIICVDDDGQPHGWREGREYSPQESYALCRCGRSRRMPYCDGSHAGIEFDGTETAGDTPYLEQADTLEGPELTLTDAEGFCMGAGFCHRAAGTWTLTRRSADPSGEANGHRGGLRLPLGKAGGVGEGWPGHRTGVRALHRSGARTLNPTDGADLGDGAA